MEIFVKAPSSVCLFLSLILLVGSGSENAMGEDLPQTLMTTCGALLVDQPLDKPLPPFDGKSNGFASGFKGWRYNSAARGGKWTIADGYFTGVESLEAKHPATASHGFPFKDVVIQCEVRMNDVPMGGRPARFLGVRTTDEKDYVCSVILKPDGFRIQKDDNDHGGPDKAVPLGEKKMPLALNEWIPVVFEILGDEMTVTVQGQSLTGSHPLITSGKHSVMFVCGVEGSVRRLKVWQAKPNSKWTQNKEAMSSVPATR